MCAKSHLLCSPPRSLFAASSITIKFRIVFDGSCKNWSLSKWYAINRPYSSGWSVFNTNEILHVKYVLTADIKQMYRQVLVNPDQISLQCILWRKSTDESIWIFEFFIVTCGTASAAFLAICSLRKLAEDNVLRYIIGSKAVLNDFYIDDLVTSTRGHLARSTNYKGRDISITSERPFQVTKMCF